MIELRKKLLPQERDRHEGDDENERDPDPILPEGEDRLVRLVARLELPGFAIEHGDPQTRSMMRSPKRPCGRNSRKTSAIT